MLCRKHHTLHEALPCLMGQGVPTVPRAEILMVTRLWLMPELHPQQHLSAVNIAGQKLKRRTISLWLETAHTQMIKILGNCSWFKISLISNSCTIIGLRNKLLKIISHNLYVKDLVYPK